VSAAESPSSESPESQTPAEHELHEARIRAVQRRTLWTLSIATILGGLGVGAALSVGALLLAEVSGNDAISGLASATFNGGAALAGIPLARIAARYGRRRALVTGSLVAMLGAFVAILGSAIGQWWVLAIGLAMLGVASAVQLLSRFAAADLAQPKNRARDLSLVVWAITIGAVVGPNLLGPGAVVGEMIGLTPLAGVFVFPIIAQGLAALITWVLLRPDPLLLSRTLPDPTAEQMAAASSNSKKAAPAKALLGNKQSQVLTIFAIAMAQAIMVALMAMTPLHLMHHDGTPQLVGFTLSLHIAGMYGLSPLIGFLAGRIGSLQTMAIGWVVLLSSVVFSYFSGASHFTVQLAMVLLGVGWGLVTVAGAALLTEITPATERTKWQGRSDTFMSAAGAVAGVFSGVIFALSDFSFLAVVSSGLLACGAVASMLIAGHQRKAAKSNPELA
jgi:MFS family permease